MSSPGLEEDVSEDGCSSSGADLEATVRHNLLVESVYSGFTGIFMGMILFTAPVIAKTCLNATVLELTIIVAAFPCGAFMGPLWAGLGRRWGMQRLVTRMAIVANLPLFLMFWVDNAVVFTAVVTISQLLHSAMRMGQSSMYRASYPREFLGKALGRLTFCTYITMVPTVLLAGWLSSEGNYPDSYRYLYPAAAMAGLVGCLFYSRIRLLDRGSLRQKTSLQESIRDLRNVVVNDRAYMLFQLAFFLSGSAFFMSHHITLTMSHDRLSFTAADLSFWLAVLPQILLAVSSLVWGQFLNHLGIVRMRLFISIIMTVYLTCYFSGIEWVAPFFIYFGSVLRGLAEGGGQVTWSLASVHFAPKADDVPVYNGIHFLLNGVRGLIMPAVGTLLFIWTGELAILAAAIVSGIAIFVVLVSLRYGDAPAGPPVPLTLDVPEADAELEAG